MPCVFRQQATDSAHIHYVYACTQTVVVHAFCCHAEFALPEELWTLTELEVLHLNFPGFYLEDDINGLPQPQVAFAAYSLRYLWLQMPIPDIIDDIDYPYHHQWAHNLVAMQGKCILYICVKLNSACMECASCSLLKCTVCHLHVPYATYRQSYVIHFTI